MQLLHNFVWMGFFGSFPKAYSSPIYALCIWVPIPVCFLKNLRSGPSLPFLNLLSRCARWSRGESTYLEKSPDVKGLIQCLRLGLQEVFRNYTTTRNLDQHQVLLRLLFHQPLNASRIPPHPRIDMETLNPKLLMLSLTPDSVHSVCQPYLWFPI